MQVLPPANGKKLWRVKRNLSTGNPASLDANLSLECLNSSLKITAAGKQFMSKRPPLKRPKSKPGMPKDFVFVDLSPVKSSEDEESSDGASSVMSSTASSPTLAFSNDKLSPMSMLKDSFTFFEDDSFQNFPMDNYQACGSAQPAFDANLLGLGLMNMPAEYPQPSVAELAMQMHQEQLAFQRFLQFQSQFLNTPPMTHTPAEPPMMSSPVRDHKRSKSTPSIPRRKSAGGFQFKTYKGPNTSVRKPLVRKHKRCVLEPTNKIIADAKCTTPPSDSDLREFLHDPTDDLSLEDVEQFDLAYTPLTDLSDFENVDTLHKPINLDMLHGCDSAQLFKDEFDMSNFVSI